MTSSKCTPTYWKIYSNTILHFERNKAYLLLFFSMGDSGSMCNISQGFMKPRDPTLTLSCFCLHRYPSFVSILSKCFNMDASTSKNKLFPFQMQHNAPSLVLYLSSFFKISFQRSEHQITELKCSKDNQLLDIPARKIPLKISCCNNKLCHWRRGLRGRT